MASMNIIPTAPMIKETIYASKATSALVMDDEFMYHIYNQIGSERILVRRIYRKIITPGSTEWNFIFD
ncbi:hypothetical protein OUZ56_015670 [Daphnia magna]|uniref:Uncharacterized protein n=1 Tax=Daphnia magna TaxID=35525 RepID=A0ABR0ANG3_9CRUS|nr:hypothetical protein OUZ56_015670 [Daphnia magna]